VIPSLLSKMSYFQPNYTLVLPTAFTAHHIGILRVAAAIQPIIDANTGSGTIQHGNIRARNKALVGVPPLSVFAVVLVKCLEISLYQDGVCRIFHSTYESSCRASWTLAVEPLPMECSDTAIPSPRPGANFGNYERLRDGQSRVCG
jgi:hypothetical protein